MLFNSKFLSIAVTFGACLTCLSVATWSVSAEEDEAVLRLNLAKTSDAPARGGPFIPGAMRDDAIVAMLRVEGATGEMKHVRHLLYFVAEGEVSLRQGGQDIRLNTGDVMMVRARTPHVLTSGEGKALLWMVMHGGPVPESGDGEE